MQRVKSGYYRGHRPRLTMRPCKLSCLIFKRECNSGCRRYQTVWIIGFVAGKCVSQSCSDVTACLYSGMLLNSVWWISNNEPSGICRTNFDVNLKNNHLKSNNLVKNKLKTTGSLLYKKPDRRLTCWQKRYWMIFAENISQTRGSDEELFENICTKDHKVVRTATV
jgi:hypothetical protein